MISARDALEWMESKANNPGAGTLFRGQNRVYPQIKPSITRVDEATKSAMWTICRRFHGAAAGVTGYSIPSEHDRLAILQHYIGRSPVIDLTGTPVIALYFALLGAQPGDECVVYSVNRSASESKDVVFSNHDFLILPLLDGAMRHRWLRQDGYSVGPANWRDRAAVEQFDLLKLQGVEGKCFIKGDGDETLVRDLGDLEDISSDPLAGAVRGVVVAIARSLDLGIKSIIGGSKTRDPDADLTGEIEALIYLASKVGAPAEILTHLESLRSAVGRHWDTAFDCSLNWACRQVISLASPPSDCQNSIGA